MMIKRQLDYAITALKNGDYIIRQFHFRKHENLTYFKVSRKQQLYLYLLRKESRIYFKSESAKKYQLLNLL